MKIGRKLSSGVKIIIAVENFKNFNYLSLKLDSSKLKALQFFDTY